MPSAHACSKCGAELPSHISEGLCPKCSFVAAVFQAQPPGATESTTEVEPTPEELHEKIGPYKILQKIGEGGCGVVYMAEQEEPVRRRVALKVIKLGMDTNQVVARFEAERQALALMDHPNIAKIFEAGATETGRPYFVMELVKGVRITDYCDDNKLSTVARLGLFIQVCQAVQHAHQKGIIHRDIKPSNILVADHEGAPVPKIIDFGIAKATTDQRLTDQTLFTALEQFIGTPAYMSPEQAKLSGLDIDTRSDIYSLGVLLYELLTGNTPFDAKRLLEAGLDGIRQIIREEDPPKPSTRLSTLAVDELSLLATRRRSEPPKLLGMIRGDLDWIVMKTLEKDRNRRYETANGLAADLKRHLVNEPVVARPPNATYRFRKALRRHRLLFLAGSAVATTLVLGVFVSSWQAIRARRAEAHESELRKSEERARHESDRQRGQALESEDRALSLLYAADIQDVGRAIEGGRLDRARKLLKTYVPRPEQKDRRGFEWFYYSRVAEGQQEAVLLEQSNSFTHMVVAPDGRMVVLQDRDELKAFDLPKREVLHRWPLLGRRLTVSSISPDGLWIALLATNGLELLNTTTGQTTALGTGRCHVVSFAADRPWIAACPLISSEGNPSPVQIWDYKQRRLIQSFLNGGGPLLWWETNSTVLVALNYAGTLQRWNALTGSQIQKVVLAPTRPESLCIAGSVSSQGTRGVTDMSPGLLCVFDPTDGRIVCESPWPVRRSIALSNDGRIVASFEDARIRVARTDKPQEYDYLEGHLDDVTGLGFIGGTSNLVSCGEDGRVLLWEQRAKLLIPFVAGTNNAEDWASAIQAQMVLSADQRYGGVYERLWSLPSGAYIRHFIGKFLGFSPDGKEYATATSNQIQVWKCDDTSSNPVSVFPLPSGATNNFDLKLSNGGRFGAYVNSDFDILVFQARSGKVLADAAKQAHPGPQIEFSLGEFMPKSDRLVVEMESGSTIWDWQATTNPVWIPLSGDSYAASFDENWIVLRDVSRRRLKLVAQKESPQFPIELEGHNDSIVSVTFSHDGQTLASLDFRHELRLWRLPQGRLMGVIPTRVDGLSNLTFSSDDQRLYLAGQSGVQVLDAPKPAQSVGQASSAKPSVLGFSSDSIWSSHP